MLSTALRKRLHETLQALPDPFPVRINDRMLESLVQMGPEAAAAFYSKK
jgi:hypothetical protein